MSRLRIAAAQFPVGQPGGWADIQADLRLWVREAAEQGAKLLVFPEYAALRLTTLLPVAQQGDLRGQLQGLQALRDQYLNVHLRLAHQFGVHILAGSLPWEVTPGRFHNRAWLCTPDGADFQDKIVMTRFEREDWGVSGAALLKVFDTAVGKLAVNICYDAEFPLLARAQAEAGAQLILVPSCTDTLAGYWRVRIGAQARALENQCVVVQSPLVGLAPWSPAVDVNVGAAHIFCPPDRGFSADGLLASGGLDRPQWVIADVDLAEIARVREQGAVLNHRHWAETPAPRLEQVKL